MITLYNEEMEAYFRVYACVIDPRDEYSNYDITWQFITEQPNAYDDKRNAYKIINEEWNQLKQLLSDWVEYKSPYDNSYIRSYDEERYYEILKAIPYYKVYDKWGECQNENWTDTLQRVQESYFDSPFHKINQYTAIPWSADDCEFKYKLQRWSGEI